ncbi:unnamed protein product, partial [Cylicostephanus goldi]
VFNPTKPFVTIPDQSKWDHDKEAAYLYYCANETVHGIEFHTPPFSVHRVPLVADISSNFLSRPFDFKHHGVVFGGTQKNLGAAGLTVVMVRKDLIGKVWGFSHPEDAQPATPAILSYQDMVEHNSLYNTPAKKAETIYNLIDESNGFYTCAVDKQCRSYMNVCYRIKGGDEKLEAEFLKGAQARGMISLKGHRSVGGIRASLYNAVSLQETEQLADWMREFMKNQAA